MSDATQPQPDTASTPALPERLRVALSDERKRTLVLRSTTREARDTLREDRVLLHELGLLADHVKINVERGTIRFANGSTVEYLGGDHQRLDESVRGKRVDHIDGEGLLDASAAAWIKIRQS